MVSPGDLAQLAARRLWERLESGAVCVTPRDAATLIRLAHETERDRAAPDPRWAATLSQLLWTAKRHLGADGWQRFAADLRSDEMLLGLWPRPGRP